MGLVRRKKEKQQMGRAHVLDGHGEMIEGESISERELGRREGLDKLRGSRR
jgi:hypothetical protein